MKRQVRQGVFECNSSSVHAISIATNTKYSLPDRVEFGFRDFGWAVDKLSSRQERADYLYTSLAYVGDIDKLKEYIRFIHKALRNNGVEAFFEDFKLSVYGRDSDDVKFYIYPNDGYVDHGNETREFVEAVCSDEKLLLDYLFSDKSYILTGNDNDDIETEIHEDYPHREFYKWN